MNPPCCECPHISLLQRFFQLSFQSRNEMIGRDAHR